MGDAGSGSSRWWTSGWRSRTAERGRAAPLGEIERDEPEAFAAWHRGGAEFRFPGGESLGEHVARVGEALDAIARGEQPALVVCHGGTVRSALIARGGRGFEEFQRIPVPNAELVALEAA